MVKKAENNGLIYILVVILLAVFALFTGTNVFSEPASETIKTSSGEKLSDADKAKIMEEGKALVEKGEAMVEKGIIMKDEAETIGSADKMLKRNMAARMIEDGMSMIKKGNQMLEQGNPGHAGKALTQKSPADRDAMIKEADKKIAEGKAIFEKGKETGDYRMRDAGTRMIRDGMITKKQAEALTGQGK